MLKIAPSIMCGDLLNIGKQIKELEEANIELLHLDIMDGHFVPGFTFGVDFVRQLRDFTQIPLQLHLMSDKSLEHIDIFIDSGVDEIIIHPECNYNLYQCITIIKSSGKKAGIALNPGTSINIIEDILPEIDSILILTINPGFIGQPLLPHCLLKAGKLAKMREKNSSLQNIKIVIDGGIKENNILDIANTGADYAVIGTGIFHNPQPITVLNSINKKLS